MEKIKITDPIADIERKIKEINDKTGNRTRSIFRKYPIFFSLIITFGVAAVFNGFQIFFNNIQFVQKNPLILVLIGLIILVITGSVYKVLDKPDNF